MSNNEKIHSFSGKIREIKRKVNEIELVLENVKTTSDIEIRYLSLITSKYELPPNLKKSSQVAFDGIVISCQRRSYYDYVERETVELQSDIEVSLTSKILVKKNSNQASTQET